ncbi:MAG: GAF domain-containing protein [Chloroflexi bacterium]|uniref:GAF domain-containing protein n=1 Tax=Candidatus Flexifilum breve TaxID=3140694 RepID=UPI0031362FCB|nr:GAF domain-containing protein [Chloroflexota bacterium]
MADVFVSYSRKNQDFAKRLIDSLNSNEKSAWIDWEAIPRTAPNWWNEIKAGIEAADNFMFIISNDSMASIFCNLELDYAFELKKRIIPIVYLDVEIRSVFASVADFIPDLSTQERLGNRDPLVITRDNWRKISRINWCFLRDSDEFEQGFSSLLASIQSDLEYVKAHTKYVVRAIEWEQELRDDDLLLVGSEIDRAEDWLRKAETFARAPMDKGAGREKVANPLPSEIQRRYIQTSRERADHNTKKTRQSEQMIQGLSMISSAMSETTGIGEICKAILDVLSQIIEYDRGSIQVIVNNHRAMAAYKGFEFREGEFLLRPVFEDSLVTEILKSNRITIISDTRDNENWVSNDTTRDERSWIGVPLYYRTEAVGLITISHHKEGVYPDEVRTVIEPFAYQAAIALHSARLQEELWKTSNFLRFVHDFTLEMLQSSDTGSILSRLVEVARQHTQADGVVVYIFDRESEAFSTKSVYSEPSSVDAWLPNINTSKSAVSMVAELKKVIWIEDIAKSEHFDTSWYDKGIRSAVCLPLLAHNQILGVLFVFWKDIAVFNEMDVEVLSTIATYSAITLKADNTW